MRLVSIKYTEFKSQSSEWKIEEFSLQEINLIVGKNSDGKTRTLNVITGLGNMMANPSYAVSNCDYEANFEDEGKQINYKVAIHANTVTLEKLTIDGESLIDRNTSRASIWNVLVKKSLESQVPSNQLMITRRDSIQYTYLENLYNWGVNVKHFRFGTELGKDLFSIDQDKSMYNRDPNLKETDKVSQVFLRGNKLYPKIFKKSILEDLSRIGYSINEINYGIQEDFPVNINSQRLSGLLLKETGRTGSTSQISMSTGMFRALAIIIYFNFYQVSNIRGSVLIDDIGEGLDYDRSTKLINLIIEKAKDSGIQLLMSTNDRFVMNQVPLEYWQVINRVGGCVKMYNHINHPKIFDEFTFTGLNNFDFFSTGFFKEGFKED